MEKYFDNASTTKVCDEVKKSLNIVLDECYGNPSSTHTLGRKAEKLLTESRQKVAKALGAKENEIYFTSCGSESDNWALFSSCELQKRKGKHIISSVVEHDAIRVSLDKLEKEGYSVTRLKPDNTGKISVDDVIDNIRDDTVLISLMLVNNETGAINDIAEISKRAKKKNKDIIVHTDAVQAFKKIDFSAKTLGADLISISGHKIHALKGIGALYIKEGLKLPSFILGGSQENEKRAGTEALPQIVSFATACTLDPQVEKIKELKEYFIKELEEKVEIAKYIKTDAPHIVSISLPGYKSEVLMNFLEEREIYVSKSSACKKGKRSHVLEALGLDNRDIDGALRISFSRYNTKEDVDSLIEGLKDSLSLMHS